MRRGFLSSLTGCGRATAESREGSSSRPRSVATCRTACSRPCLQLCRNSMQLTSGRPSGLACHCMSEPATAAVRGVSCKTSTASCQEEAGGKKKRRGGGGVTTRASPDMDSKSDPEPSLGTSPQRGSEVSLAFFWLGPSTAQGREWSRRRSWPSQAL